MMLKIDPTISGLIGVIIGFLLGLAWDVKKEKDRRNQELDKVKKNLIIELTQNKLKIEGHIKILESEH